MAGATHPVPSVALATEPGARAFRRAFVAWSLALGAVSGVVLALQAGYGFSRFDAIEMAGRVIALQIARKTAAGVSCTAVLFALIAWAHDVPTPELRARLPRMLARAAVVSLGNLPFAAALQLAVGGAVLAALFGLRWPDLASGIERTVEVADLAGGLAVWLASATVVAVVAWVALPRLARTGWSRRARIAVVWASLIGVRFAIGLLVLCVEML